MGVKCYDCLICFSRENDGKDMALRYRMFRHTHMATYWEHIATDGSSLMALDRPGKYAALTRSIVASFTFMCTGRRLYWVGVRNTVYLGQ